MDVEEGDDTSAPVTVLVCFGQRKRAVTFKRTSSVSDLEALENRVRDTFKDVPALSKPEARLILQVCVHLSVVYIKY